MKQLKNIFSPKTIAIFGASDKDGSVGKTIAENLKLYKGNIYYINPRIKKLFGKKVYSSVLDIDNFIDLAIIAVPSNIALKITKELAIKKCKNIVMITAGFNEVGSNKLTDDLMNIIKKYKINLIGPNCLGILNTSNNLNATFIYEKRVNVPKKGNVSVISQSGALGIAILDLANYENLKINKFISYGNALDVDEGDLLEYLGDDKKTKVIVCYIEGVSNGKKFFKILKKVSKIKKVIILKGGKSEKGNKAVKSHTAVIAGSSKVFDAAIKQAGAYSVDSISKLFNLTKLFSVYPKSKIKNVQIITNGGGFGVVTSDQLEINKIKLAELHSKTKNKIRKIVPTYATIGNPLDLTGDADNNRFAKCLDLCLKDNNTSAILLLLLLQLPSIDNKIVDTIIKVKRNTTKPIFVLSIGGTQTKKIIDKFEEKNIICFKDAKDMADTLNYIKL